MLGCDGVRGNCRLLCDLGYMETDMMKRFNNYLINSCKVAILGFIWYGLFKFPWKSLVNAPLGGKIFVVVMMWAIWSFMVMIVSGELDDKRGKNA